MKKQYSMTVTALLALVLTLTSPLAFAADVVATVSKNQVVKNEVFQLRIVVDEKVSADALDTSKLEQDFYVGRPSFGSSINIINGDRSTRSEWNITLAAQRLGIATIPAFMINGSSSQPISIQVSMDADEPKSSDLVEVQNSLSSEVLYPNESAILTTRLIVKTDPRRLQNPTVTPPKAQGLSLTELGKPQQYQSVLDGVEVTVLDQSYRVTADSAGEFKLYGIGFQGSVVYADSRTGTTKLVSAKTPAKQFTLTVEPIPNDYQGAWLPSPSLALSQVWSDSDGKAIDDSAPFNTKQGESITREIHLDIQGLASERFPNLKVSYPNTVRLYEEKPQFSDLGNGITRMTIKQVLIAEQTGTIELSDIKLNWWNSKSKTAETAAINGLTLEVEQASAFNHELLQSQPAPKQAIETVTVYDAGIWPYLTALFAGLWLVTLLLWLKNHTPRKTSIETSQTETKTAKKLIDALQQGDNVKASFLAQQWLDENPNLNAAIKQEVEQQVNLMNQSQFSETNGNWQPKHLIRLIKQANKTKIQNKTSDSTLAHL